jgi:hypothetical protein
LDDGVALVEDLDDQRKVGEVFDMEGEGAVVLGGEVEIEAVAGTSIEVGEEAVAQVDMVFLALLKGG